MGPRVANPAAPATGAITGLRFTTVCVRDHDVAIAFYVGKLGFELRDDSAWGAGYRWVEVAPPGAQTSLVLITPSLQMMGAERASWAQEQIGGLTGLAFETDDLDAAFQTLAARGVHFSERPAPRSWGGCVARFADPDGNSFLLVQPDGASPRDEL